MSNYEQRLTRAINALENYEISSIRAAARVFWGCWMGESLEAGSLGSWLGRPDAGQRTENILQILGRENKAKREYIDFYGKLAKYI